MYLRESTHNELKKIYMNTQLRWKKYDGSRTPKGWRWIVPKICSILRHIPQMSAFMTFMSDAAYDHAKQMNKQ